MDQISEMDAEAFAPPFDDNFEARATLMQNAANLSKETFGERHWHTVLKQSLADGLKSVAGLPSAKQELLREGLTAKLTAASLAAQGKRDLALRGMRRANERLVAAIGADHILTNYSLFGIVYDEARLEASEIAKEHAQIVVGFAARQWGKDHPAYGHALRNLAWAESQLREFESAEKHLQQAIAILEPVATEGLSDFYIQVYAIAHSNIARVYNEQGRYAEGEMPARQGVELLALHPNPHYVDIVAGLLEVARSESGQGRYAKAEITFTAVRRIQLSLRHPWLTEHFTTLFNEHRDRARTAAGNTANRQTQPAVKK